MDDIPVYRFLHRMCFVWFDPPRRSVYTPCVCEKCMYGRRVRLENGGTGFLCTIDKEVYTRKYWCFNMRNPLVAEEEEKKALKLAMRCARAGRGGR